MSQSNRLEPIQEEQRPKFDAPWQAEAYALVQVLIETGRISGKEWGTAFGAALHRAATAGEPDNGDTYYAALSQALEHLLVAGGAVKGAEVGERVNAWRTAYHRTPHGMPVRLSGD